VKPVLQALVLADHVYRDQFTGKMIVAGIFNQIALTKKKQQSQEEGPRRIEPKEFIRSGSPYCYLNLTSVRGELPLEIRYVDLNDNSILMNLRFQVSNSDPLKNLEIVVPIPTLPAPHPGSYVMELLSDDELIGSHRITAIEPNEENI
jgi:hypothetical protein